MKCFVSEENKGKPVIVRFCLWLVIVLCTIAGQAQTITFKKKIISDVDNLGWSVLELEDTSGYIMLGGGASYAINSQVVVKIFKTDIYGNVVLYKEYGETGKLYYPGRSGSVIRTSDGHYIFGGSVEGNNTSSGLIMKFDENLDTIWTKQFPSPRYNILYQCRETSDKGFILVGSTSTTDPNANFWLLKTDSLGNKLWEKQYGGQYREIGRDIELTSDGGYLLTGDKHLDQTSDSRVGYIVKTDSFGNLEWDKTYGTQDGGDSPMCIASLSNNKYLLSGYMDTLASDPPPYVAKMDDTGNIEWLKLFTEYLDGFFWQYRELEDGNILLAGESVPNGAIANAALLIKIDQLGEIIWERMYAADTNKYYTSYIRDFQETSDKGIILTGMTDNLETSGIIRQQFLLMKLDSNGCLENDCGILSGIDEPEAPIQQVYVYPNPVQETATVYYNHGDPGGKLSFSLYNMAGQQLHTHTEQLNGYGYGEWQIDCSGFTSGVYLYEITTTAGVVANGKLVVE